MRVEEVLEKLRKDRNAKFRGVVGDEVMSVTVFNNRVLFVNEFGRIAEGVPLSGEWEELKVPLKFKQLLHEASKEDNFRFIADTAHLSRKNGKTSSYTLHEFLEELVEEHGSEMIAHILNKAIFYKDDKEN